MEQRNSSALDNERLDWAEERRRLIRICARITGDFAAAEDLAQETLLEAWRTHERLRDPERERQWLGGIARNMSLRWLRARTRESAHMLDPLTSESDEAPSLDALCASDTDVTVDLERQELIALLDGALALLPSETRAALIAHYVEQTPLAELAASLGTSNAAVAMRLQRGKLALRRVLINELPQHFAPHAPDLYTRHAWEETPLWCATCGQSHLLGRYHVEQEDLWLRCPRCSPDPAHTHFHVQVPGALAGVRGYRRAHERALGWTHRFYTPHLRNQRVPCFICGAPTPVTHERPGNMAPSPIGNTRGIRHICHACNSDCWESLDSIALATPAARAFARRNPRIRTLPQQEVEAHGRLVVIARFESATSAERLTLLADAETFEPLATEG